MRPKILILSPPAQLPAETRDQLRLAIGDWLATGSGVSVGDGSGNAILDSKFAAAGTNSSIAFTLTTPSRYIGFYSIWVSSGNT